MDNVQKRRDGPARESLASSLGEGWELDRQRGEGRGIFRESIERGVTGCSGSASPAVASVCADWLGRGRTGRRPRQGWPTGSCLEKTRKKESRVDVRFPWVWLPAEWLAELIPRPGQEREVWGGYRERCDWSVRGCSLASQAGLGVVFFLPRAFQLLVGDRWLR